jgi:hypothetical protein
MSMSDRLSNDELSQLEYPDETLGSTAAREIRQEANHISDAEREEHFRSAMQIIYGGGDKTVRVRH